MNAFRSILLTAMRHRWITVAATPPVVVSLLLLPRGAATVLPRRPSGTARRYQPAAERSILHDDAAARTRYDPQGQSEVASWSTYVGRRVRFTRCRMCLNNDFFAQAVVVAGMLARATLHAALDKALSAEEFPDAVSRVSPLNSARLSAGLCNIASAAPISTRRVPSHCASEPSSVRTTSCAASTTTGWRLPGKCASRSTRTSGAAVRPRLAGARPRRQPPG